MPSEVLHPQTKGSTRPEGLKLEARLRLTHADVIQAAHFLAGTMGALGLSGAFKHHLLLLFTMLSILKSVPLAKQGDKKNQINKQD